MREPHEIALREWIVQATGLADDHVIFAEQSSAGPRPTKPYGTLLVLSEVMADGNMVTTDQSLGAGVSAVQSTSVAGTMSVQFFSDHSEHRALMANLVFSLRDPASSLHFQTTGIAVTIAGSAGFSDEPEELPTSYEPRTQRDFMFTFRRTRTIEVQPIDSVTVTKAVA